jgi:hypothetical protein
MTLNIRNNGRQYLELELPPGAKVWSAFVAGQPVRPSLRANTLLLPLERSVDDAFVTVQLVYVGAYPFPKSKGDIELFSPKVDLPLKNVRWELYLPPDYSYSKYGGSMTHEAGEAQVIQVYSQEEYQQQEVSKKQAQRTVSVNNLKSLKQSIASGKLGGNESYNYFRNADVAQDEATAREFKALQKDFNRRQSANLFESQQGFAMANAAKLGDLNQQRLVINSTINAPGQQGKPMAQQPAQQQAQNPVAQNDSDLEVAEQQWERLEKAQQVKVAKVQPLRANLPTRGQRHLFTQVLQTEVNKPLTISFNASTTRSSGWLARIIWGIGCFLALWIIVAVWPEKKKSR